MLEMFSSVMIYLFTFFSSIIFFWIWQNLYIYGKKKQDLIFRKFAFFIAVLLPSLLAGLRANTVGIDVNVYIVPNMHIARTFRNISFFEFCDKLGMAPEYLYMLLVFICARITADEGLLLFMLQFFTVVPIALAAAKLKKELSVPLAMATYYFCFYNTSLNMMRQFVACAFILLGVTYLLNDNMKISIKALACFVTAFFFHKSALIGIFAIYVICMVSAMKLKRWAYILIYISIILFPVIITPIFEILNSYGLMSKRFIYYADIFLYKTINVDAFFFESPYSLRYTVTTICLLGKIVVPCYFLRSYNYFDNNKITTIRSIALCGTMIYLIIQYTMNTIYGNRISAFFDFLYILLVPYAAHGRNKQTKSIILWITIIIYWFSWVILLDWSGRSRIYTFRF